ncbi:MAG TPA: hypothetical protein VI036_20350 [Propionibacteriaceae bacterium]
MEPTEQARDRADVYMVIDEPAYLQSGQDEKPAISAEPMPDLRAPRACSFCKRAAEHLFGEQYQGRTTPAPSSMASGSVTPALCGLPAFSEEWSNPVDRRSA